MEWAQVHPQSSGYASVTYVHVGASHCRPPAANSRSVPGDPLSWRWPLGDGVIGSPQAFGALQSRFESESPTQQPREGCSPAVPENPAAAPVAVVVLAAGEGTRMKSRALPKVLHGFAGRSLLGHVLAAGAPLGATQTLVVVGHRRDEVTAHLDEVAPDAVPVVQAEQNGTGHAVRLALEAVPADAAGVVVVVPGDAPLLTPDTLAALVDEHLRAEAAA